MSDSPDISPHTDEQIILLRNTKTLLYEALTHLQQRYISLEPLHTVTSLVFKGLDKFTGKEIVLKCFEQSEKNQIDMYSCSPDTETEDFLLSHFYNYPVPHLAYPIDRLLIDKRIQLAEWTAIEHIRELLPSNFVVYVFIYYPYTLETIDLKSTSSEDRERWCRQLAVALKTLHDLGFYYGDVKPSNICIEMDTPDRKSRVQLIDFGMTCPLKNVHYIKNTIFFFTPIQAVNHSPLYSTEFFSFEIQQSITSLLRRTGLVEPTLKKAEEGYIYHPEHGIRVDLFGLAQMILYIFGNGFLFYSTKVLSEFSSTECRKMLIGCIEFILDSHSFVHKSFKAFEDSGATPLPNGWKKEIEMMLIQVLNSPPSETKLTFDHFQTFLPQDEDEDEDKNPN